MNFVLVLPGRFFYAESVVSRRKKNKRRREPPTTLFIAAPENRDFHSQSKKFSLRKLI